MRWGTATAYAIGLITTDGNLSKDGRHITFVSKDLDLVKLFKKCLKLCNKVSYKTSGFSQKKGRYYYVQFSNVRFYRYLRSIGLHPAKSKTISELRIPEKYFPDFLRGHLDGDGYIKVYQDSVWKNNQRLYISFLSASKRHIDWLQSTIKTYIGLSGRIRIVPRAWALIYAKKESKILLRYIYYRKNIPFLTRKRNLVSIYL